ncbi:hypothetical protein JK359_33430 [Streptomyces actinomycinicus]|uniref:Uncharacterized protein n=1 Tax=Streptomyces actinomycinicus TaxID=1695166 RepID=A0A937ERQ7_9ACTN|nr:hypothetical protein [Streptomyces actinomycinicus]MBL1086809.1 hypothetical protein [Streptomyces actinomycinicus]
MHARTSVTRTPARRTAAEIMRQIAARSPRLGRTPESVCTRQQCHVAWRGEENDCWHCGLPATATYRRRGSALQRLLAQVDAGTARKAVAA